MKPIDELARKKEIEEVKDQFRLLHKVYDGGKRDPDLWHKSLIYMAYRFARINAVEDALDLVALLPQNWFSDTLPREMELDKTFSVAALELAKILVENRVVTVDTRAAMNDITQFIVGKA